MELKLSAMSSILLERRDNCLTVVKLNRPEAGNAINT